MFQPLVCVVDFHHVRGPEIEHWIGADGGDPITENDWHLIPYMALPDGAHQSAEEFSYFSLVYKGRSGQDVEPTSVFGISCMHQIASANLIYRPEEVTRSAVQKSIVAITDKPQAFGAVRERLSAVTKAWFAQRDFRDLEILQVGQCYLASRLRLTGELALNIQQQFQESLAAQAESEEDDRDQFFGLSLREIVHTFKWQTLVLLKALLLQPKVCFRTSSISLHTR